MIVRKDNIIKLGLFAYLTATTIGFASVNDFTLAAIPFVRNLSIFIAIGALIYSFSRLTLKVEALAAIVLIVLLYTLGLMRGLGNLNYINYMSALGVSFFIVVTGALYFSNFRSAAAQVPVAAYFLLLAICVVIILIATRGLILAGIPRFNFDIMSSRGGEVSYSQGVSKFFGLACIASIWLLGNVKRRSGKTILLVLFVGFFGISFLGGGRGDFLALVIIIFAMSFSSGWRGALLGAFLGILLYIIVFEVLLNASTDLVSAQRFLVLLEGNDFGLRDVLFAESFDLLLSEEGCLFFGCGYTYFQKYYGYEYGFYPHNIFLEAMIVWGVPLVLMFLVAVVVGFVKRARFDFLTWIGAYFVLIALKSGDIIGSWFALSFLFFYAGVGVSNLFAAGNSNNWQRTPE